MKKHWLVVVLDAHHVLLRALLLLCVLSVGDDNIKYINPKIQMQQCNARRDVAAAPAQHPTANSTTDCTTSTIKLISELFLVVLASAVARVPVSYRKPRYLSCPFHSVRQQSAKYHIVGAHWTNWEILTHPIIDSIAF
jgi:hypothetical protein